MVIYRPVLKSGTNKSQASAANISHGHGRSKQIFGDMNQRIGVSCNLRNTGNEQM